MPKQLSLALLCLSINLCQLPALAQQPPMNHRGLQPAEPFHAKRQMRILDESPDVVDLRQPKQSSIVRIHVGAVPDALTQVTDVYTAGSQPSGRDGSPSAGAPGVITVDMNKLPASRFDTNIPARGIAAPNNLGDGTTTNRLARLSGSMHPPTPTLIVSKSAAPQAVSQAPKQRAETYAQSGGSGDGQADSVTKGYVKGKLIKGSLLLGKN
jgi:hypothetical protein